MNLWCDGHQAVNLVNPADLMSRFYLRFNALDVPGVVAKLSTALGDAGISISAIRQQEVAVGQFVPLVITTHLARQGSVTAALDRICKLDVIAGRPVSIRIVDTPEN